ncbi:MAG TPA: hypothetical protein VKN76_12325, partial [Kiloniellaceae bacterium]|nr:hypothetical protein [Kiloniellaceae bacterium]
MARTDGPLRAARQHYADRNSHFTEETPLGSEPGDDPLDELIAGLTPTFDVELAKPAGAGFPSVEDLHYEESAARNMASRFAPNPNPRPKIRRSRLRRAARDSWRFSYEQAEREEQNGGLLEDRWSPPRSTEVPRRRGRTMFWRISAGLLIAASILAVYGLVKPLNDLPPNRRGNIAGNPAANLPDGGVTSAEIEAAGSSVGSDLGAPETERQVATIAVRRVTTIPVTRAAAAPSAPAPVAQAGSGSDEQARSQAVAGRQILNPGATGLQSGTTASTAGDDALSGSRSAPSEKSEDRPFEPALQRSAQADSAPTTGSLAGSGEPVSGEAQPVEPQLSA